MQSTDAERAYYALVWKDNEAIAAELRQWASDRRDRIKQLERELAELHKQQPEIDAALTAAKALGHSGRQPRAVREAAVVAPARLQEARLSVLSSLAPPPAELEGREVAHVSSSGMAAA